MTAGSECIAKGKLREEKAYLSWWGKVAPKKLKMVHKYMKQAQEKLRCFEWEIDRFRKNYSIVFVLLL